MIELWAMLVFAAIIGFLGPFGTYLDADFPTRVWNWWTHLMGAYVLVRPSIVFWLTVADATGLPRKMLLLWGVMISSFPLTLIWQWGAGVFFQSLGGFTGILPFAFLSAVAVLAIVWWAANVDVWLQGALPSGDPRNSSLPPSGPQHKVDQARGEGVDLTASAKTPAENSQGPRLERRLSPGFAGPIAALQSEDHYVRVHGRAGSELVFMRLRDAIAEMDGHPGQQVHRSWWIAADGIMAVKVEGRGRIITLPNGASAPVARESVARLERLEFLPVPRSGEAAHS